MNMRINKCKYFRYVPFNTVPLREIFTIIYLDRNRSQKNFVASPRLQFKLNAKVKVKEKKKELASASYGSS